MILYNKGNILQDPSEALVNPVNTVGVMGAGLALQFKKAWPDNFHAYRIACSERAVRFDRPFLFTTKKGNRTVTIINLATKGHWKEKSSLKNINTGLVALREIIETQGIASIAIPPLGCGLGGLTWSQVGPLIRDTLEGIPNTTINVYPPRGTHHF